MGNNSQSKLIEVRMYDQEIIIDKRGNKSLVIGEVLPASFPIGYEGLKLWGTGIVLARYIYHHQSAFAGKRVLEIGTGVGIGGLAALKWGSPMEVLMTDSEPSVVENCAKNIQKNQLKSVKPRVFNWRGSGSIEGKYDIIMSSQSMVKPDTVSEMYKVLKECLVEDGEALVIMSQQDQQLVQVLKAEINSNDFKWNIEELPAIPYNEVACTNAKMSQMKYPSLKNSKYSLLSMKRLFRKSQKETPKVEKVKKAKKNKESFQKLTLRREPLSSEESTASNNSLDEQSKLQWIRKNIIGFNTQYVSPLGMRLEAVYVDHTATNRPFKAIETMVEYAKLFTANPHTEFSHYGKHSTEILHYSHASLMESFNISADEYAAIPTGAGCTAAIEKTIRVLKDLFEIEKTRQQKDKITSTVFMTPYEHHSNILSWVEFFDKVEVLKNDEDGTLKIDEIEKQLLECESDYIIVTISAASNTTSKQTDLAGMNRVIRNVRKHKKNVIFNLDCAAYCCHHQLDLGAHSEVDFAFISPHKNLGGSETVGILVGRKSVIAQLDRPTFPGGGTVTYVKGFGHQDFAYHKNVFSREVVGTPNYIGFYRAALSFELLNKTIGYDFINKREKENTQLFFNKIQQGNSFLSSTDTHIKLYGEMDLTNRANVVVFNLEYGDSRTIVQQNFVSLVLSDLFGIQLRSGCFCAGPFGVRLLNLEEEVVNRIHKEVLSGYMVNKPGYLRLDLTFYLEDYEVKYAAEAIIMVALHWKKLINLYSFKDNGQVTIKSEVQFDGKRKDLNSLDSLKEVSHLLKNVRKLGSVECPSDRKHRLEAQMEQAKRFLRGQISTTNQ